MATYTVQTRISVQHYGASAIPLNTAGSIMRCTWTMDAFPRWIGDYELPSRYEGEWVGTFKIETDEMEKFLWDLFETHAGKIEPGCNYKGRMEHVVEEEAMPPELIDCLAGV